MSIGNIKEALVDSMKDMLHAEKQLAQSLPEMAQKASNTDLEAAFDTHLNETKQHITRLEDAFESLGLQAEVKTCPAMQGLVQESQEIIKEAADDETRDALMIAAAQKIEHYEIASYGTMICWADEIGENRAAELFRSTIDEEKNADQTLTRIAENKVNVTAQS